MDMGEVKSFNAELSGLYDNKPPISKAKMSAITKGAIKAIKFYKHVVHSVEKFIQKCKPEYKVPGLYVIDSIVRQSRHQFGQDKDVFAPRFAKNMQQTFANLFRCPPEDKRNIIRVLNLWQKNNVFTADVIQPLMDMADPSHPLHAEIQQQQNNNANGSNLNLSHNSMDNKSPMPAAQHTPHAPSPMGDQFQDQPSGPPGVKFNRKLLNDFEYESEDDNRDGGPSPSPPPPQQHHHQHQQHQHQLHQHQQQASKSNNIMQPQNNATDALGSILTNPEIMRQLQSLQAQMQMMTGMQMPNLQNLMPMMSDMQQQNQVLPFMNSQQEQPKPNESKDEMANESDIEFVETGPQVIEIPDANDSRSPSPARRGSPRSRSPRRRRRTPERRHRRTRDRDRDRDRDREKERERDSKSVKEREAEKEKQREREKKGLPPIKKDHLSVCSTTLWVGHVSKLATAEELSDLFGALGGVSGIDVVAPRGCAFVVMERRRDAARAKHKLDKHKLHSKEITVAWAPGKGVKGREWKDYWEAEAGVSYLPWQALQAQWQLAALSLDALEDGGQVDEDSLPPWLPPRIMPKLDMAMLGLPPAPQPPLLGSLPHGPGSLTHVPGSMPHVPGSMPHGPGSLPHALSSLAAMPGSIPLPPPALPLTVPMPPPGMPGLPPGLPPGMRPPSLPPNVPGLQREGLTAPGALLGFPPGMPPQTMGQPGMVGSYLSGLVNVGGIMTRLPLPQMPPTIHQQPPPQRQSSVTHTHDAMELDAEEADPPAPPLLSDQLQALLSKPPPMFNSSEPPPGFNMSEPPPSVSQPDSKDSRDSRDDERRDSRDRGDRRGGDRRDRDRRGGDRRDRDRDSRDNRDDRRDRERERGRDRRDRDRDRERDRDRNTSRDNKSREKSPRAPNPEPTGEKSLRDRLWEMANGNPPRVEDKNDADMQLDNDVMDEHNQDDVPDTDGPPPGPGWGPPDMAPPFRPGMRMRGPPRQPIRGPWMDGNGPPPPFMPRFNGMGPPFNRPPFERPPFEGGPLFDGPPRFERPPFNRMPFDGPRPPFDGPRPPFDGPRPPRQFDPPFDQEPPQFDGPPRFDGPPEFFDRNNRRFDDREQFNDRWNPDRDREWDRDRRNNEWDDRRRDRRSRDHEDGGNPRFRDRGDRRRNFEDRPRPSRDERGDRQDNSETQDKNETQENNDKPERPENPENIEKEKVEKPDKPERASRRDKDRKSRWGAAEEPAEYLQNEDDIQEHIANLIAQSNSEATTVVPTEQPVTDISQPMETTNEDNEHHEQERHDDTEVSQVKDIPMAVEQSHSETDAGNTESNVQEHVEAFNDKEQDNGFSFKEPEDSFTQETAPEYDTNKEVTFESKADEVAPTQAAPDLYDATDAVDTSFSLPEQTETEQPSEDKQLLLKAAESPNSSDIFNQESNPRESEQTRENKDSLETP